MGAPIVLITDFGLEDSYVGQLKGAILSVNARAKIVDLLHEVPPYGIEMAAYQLAYTCRYFPKGSVFVCVVDPGVGTARAAIALRAGGRYFVGPDNGLFSILIRKHVRWTARQLTNRAYWRTSVSRTFHGRDIFAPVGAHVLRRRSVFGRLGPERRRITLLRAKPPVIKDRSVSGRIIHVDHFGNLLTNIESQGIPDHAVIRWRRRCLRNVAATYGGLKRGSLAAVRNSFGLIELAVREGSAKRVGKGRIGDRVSVSWS